MSILMKYELKKIWIRKTTIITVCILGILMIIFPISSANSKFWCVSYDEATDKTIELNGFAAIPHKRNALHKEKGYLTSERFAGIIEKNNKLMSSPDNVEISTDENSDGGITSSKYLKNKFWLQTQSVNEIEWLLSAAFSTIDNYNFFAYQDLKPKDASKFYSNRNKLMNDNLNQNYSYGNYTTKEKQIFNEMNSKITTPFYYDYIEGWEVLLENTSPVTILLTIALLISISPVFSSEYQTGADSILLTTRYGRAKLASVKMKTSFIFGTALYFAGHLFHFIVTMLIFGAYGFNCPLQLSEFLSPYSINHLQGYLIYVLLGYVALLMITSLVLFLSSKMKTPFATIILSTVLFLFPLFIPASKFSRMINHIVLLFPINIMNGDDILNSFTLFNFFGNPLQQIPVYFITLSLLTIILIPFAINSFKKHQVS